MASKSIKDKSYTYDFKGNILFIKNSSKSPV